MSAISYIRKNVLRVSQAELGAIAGVTQATVSRWEAGELCPNLNEMASIRTAARKVKGAAWKDAFFFDPPKPVEAPADAERSRAVEVGA